MTHTQYSSGTHDALKEYISDWARIIYDATGDQMKGPLWIARKRLNN